MAYSNEVIEALGTLRQFTGPNGGKLLPGQLVQVINVLDNAGVFRELDEQTGYAPAEDDTEH
jgi:hypothetical protein